MMTDIYLTKEQWNRLPPEYYWDEEEQARHAWAELAPDDEIFEIVEETK